MEKNNLYEEKYQEEDDDDDEKQKKFLNMRSEFDDRMVS